MPDAKDSILTVDYVSVICVWIGFVISLTISLLFFRDLHRANKIKLPQQEQESNSNPDIRHDKDQKIIAYSSIACIILFTVASLFVSIILTKMVFMDKYNGNSLTHSLSAIASVPFFLAQCGLVLFILLKRMDMAYKMGQCFKRTTYILPSFTFFAVLIPVMIGFINQDIRQFAMIITGLIYLFTMIVYIILAILYLLKVKEKMRDCIINNIELDMISKDNNNEEENNHGPGIIIDLTVINNAVRYSVLLIWCVAISPLIPITGIIGNAMLRESHHITEFGSY